MVTRAAFSLLYEVDNSMDYIVKIANDDNINWRAFELFIIRYFITEKEIELTTNNGTFSLLDFDLI